MTLIVGLRYNDALVLAADTEESAGIVAKRSVQKLSRIVSKEWVLVVGGAGDGPISERASRLLRSELADCKQLTEDRLGNALDGVLATVHKKYIDPVKTSEGVSLVIGATTPDEMFLVSTHKRTPQFQDHYAYAGIGADIAIYFIENLYTNAARSWGDAAQLAGFVIKEAKESAQYVGLDSQIYVLHRAKPRWRLLGDEATNDIENHVIGWQNGILDAYTKLMRKYHVTEATLTQCAGYKEEN